jgi:hypothetical protein
MSQTLRAADFHAGKERKVAQKKGQRRGYRYKITIPSLKDRGKAPYRMVQVEAPLELDQVMLLECDPTVTTYYAQPFPIVAEFPDGSTHQYTPDFLVIRPAGNELIECKPAVFVDDEETKQQRTIGEAWAAEHGAAFHLVTDKELAAGSQLRNARLLWRHRLHNVSIDSRTRCFQYLNEHPEGVPFQELVAHLSPAESPMSEAGLVYHLLFQHELAADMEQPLTGESIIRRSAKG